MITCHVRFIVFSRPAGSWSRSTTKQRIPSRLNLKLSSQLYFQNGSDADCHDGCHGVSSNNNRLHRLMPEDHFKDKHQQQSCGRKHQANDETLSPRPRLNDPAIPGLIHLVSLDTACPFPGIVCWLIGFKPRLHLVLSRRCHLVWIGVQVEIPEFA